MTSLHFWYRTISKIFVFNFFLTSSKNIFQCRAFWAIWLLLIFHKSKQMIYFKNFITFFAYFASWLSQNVPVCFHKLRFYFSYWSNQILSILHVSMLSSSLFSWQYSHLYVLTDYTYKIHDKFFLFLINLLKYFYINWRFIKAVYFLAMSNLQKLINLRINSQIRPQLQKNKPLVYCERAKYVIAKTSLLRYFFIAL